MSSRNSPIPKELADPPTSPFQPVLAPSTSRRPIVRRPTAPPSAASTAARPSTPFGEIGKEDDDNFDALSLISGTTGWGGPDEVDEETAAFLPRVRDLRQRRPVVRKKTMDVPPPVIKEEKADVREEKGEVAAARSAGEDTQAKREDGAAAARLSPSPPPPSAAPPPSSAPTPSAATGTLSTPCA
ncbi:hypothetical protein JCM10449v2_006327 [Rhodotorula kratochvilovae]